jgi:hypothetical protein
MSLRAILRLYLSIAACAAAVAVVRPTAAHAFQLITKSEAALPAARGGHDRGISRGPTIVIVSPAPAAGTVKSPIDLKIEFKPHGGAGIDADSVLVTYMKDPSVDLTQRIKPFIGPAGIEIKDAQVPPGTHRLRVDVADTYGHEGWTDFTFTVSR